MKRRKVAISLARAGLGVADGMATGWVIWLTLSSNLGRGRARDGLEVRDIVGADIP